MLHFYGKMPLFFGCGGKEVAVNKLKQILNDEGLSQAELARETGVSTSTINRVCQQRKAVAPRTQTRLTIGVTKLSQNGKEYTVKEIFLYSD